MSGKYCNEQTYLLVAVFARRLESLLDQSSAKTAVLDLIPRTLNRGIRSSFKVIYEEDR